MAKIKRDPSLMESLNSFLKSTNFISEPKIYNRIASFHSKKVEFILQEIFARLVMYNFSELITLHVVIEKRTENMNIRSTFLSLHTFAENTSLVE